MLNYNAAEWEPFPEMAEYVFTFWLKNFEYAVLLDPNFWDYNSEYTLNNIIIFRMTKKASNSADFSQRVYELFSPLDGFV